MLYEVMNDKIGCVSWCMTTDTCVLSTNFHVSSPLGTSWECGPRRTQGMPYRSIRICHRWIL